MARNIRAPKLETRTNRLRLRPRWKPYSVRVAPGVRLAYRRKATAGSWSVIAANGKGGNWLKLFGTADDFEDANGDTVLDFWQATARARVLARGEHEDKTSEHAAFTVAAALNHYARDLEVRGGDLANVGRVRGHLSAAMLDKAVVLLTARELKRWRDGLKKSVTASSINRICNGLRAALNLAADTDERITSRRAWEVGLQAIRDATESRNIILPPEAIRRIVEQAYNVSPEFGLLVETAATTGARVSQIARLELPDVQGDRIDPRLMMPSSRKGRGQKKVTRQPVPIPENLAVRLRQAGQQSGNGRLLMKPSGEPWKRSDHTRLFARAAQRAGFDPAEITIYALRHSNIVRQLLAAVPIRVVAVNHDTSTAMIERTYSKFIGDHADVLTRPALLDLSFAPSVDNVVPIGRK